MLIEDPKLKNTIIHTNIDYDSTCVNVSKVRLISVDMLKHTNESVSWVVSYFIWVVAGELSLPQISCVWTNLAKHAQLKLKWKFNCIYYARVITRVYSLFCYSLNVLACCHDFLSWLLSLWIVIDIVIKQLPISKCDIFS